MMKLLLVATLLSCGACTSPTFETWKRGTSWVLVRVDLDLSLLANRGSLPIYHPPSDLEFGRRPMAQGSLAVSGDGRVICRVLISEPTPRGSFGYKIITFEGLYGSDPAQIKTVRPPAEPVPLGISTILHVSELPDGLLRVQGATGEKLLPYVYVFAPPPARLMPVSLPSTRL